MEYTLELKKMGKVCIQFTGVAFSPFWYSKPNADSAAKDCV